jgi:predicted O-methyltransferase YrrM
MAKRKSRPHEHALIEMQLKNIVVPDNRPPVLVEVGAGKTTKVMADYARKHKAIFYSCDCCGPIIDFLDAAFNKDKCIRFLQSDSSDALAGLAPMIGVIDFAFFDAAPCAMKTFLDFQTIEYCFRPNSIFVIDNAKLPGLKQSPGPARKGKILVPYLLAHDEWTVEAFPGYGGMMIVAVKQPHGGHADPGYYEATYDPHVHYAARIAHIKKVLKL